MDGDAMRRFLVPDRDDLPDDLCEYVDNETECVGSMPNAFATLAYRPSHFRPSFKYHDALVEDTDLEHHEAETIIVAVPGVNHCYCCSVAYGALVRIYAKDPLLMDQLVVSYHTADIPEKHKTMLDVAVKLTESPVKVDGDDLQQLRDVGFSEETTWNIGAVTAFSNLSNHAATFTDTRPNEEFHTLGREPYDN